MSLALAVLLVTGLPPSPRPTSPAAGVSQQAPPAADDASALRSEVARLEGRVHTLAAQLHERDELLGSVREHLSGVREEMKELKERPQPVAAPFLAAPPLGSDRFGVARTAVFAPRIEVESFRRHDTVLLKLRRVEATAVRTVAELELTPDAPGIDLPLDQSGALFLVEWSTSEGHLYNLVLRDGASGQPAASLPVREKQNEGRFALVGYRVD
jgi:hypothetical protein